MISQRYRFHGYGSLKFLYRRGKTVRSRSLSLRVVHNPKRSNSRCAVIVTKKVQKAAPRRNRIRRRIYEIVRTQWPHIKSSHDMLISVYDPQVIDMPYDQLEAQVIHLFKQASIWQEDKKDGIL